MTIDKLELAKMMQDADEGKPFPELLQALEDIEKKPRQNLLSRLFSGSESDDKPGVDELRDKALSLGHELHLACQYGEAEWARKALEKGAPVDGRDEWMETASAKEETPLTRAIMCLRPASAEIVRLLLEAKASLTASKMHPMMLALHVGSIEIVDMLLDLGGVRVNDDLQSGGSMVQGAFKTALFHPNIDTHFDWSAGTQP